MFVRVKADKAQVPEVDGTRAPADLGKLRDIQRIRVHVDDRERLRAAIRKDAEDIRARPGSHDYAPTSREIAGIPNTQARESRIFHFFELLFCREIIAIVKAVSSF